MGDKMKLSIPPEPLQIKKQSKTEKDNKKWDIDHLMFWFGNRLPSYLWKESGWSKHLKKEGYSWQNFLKILALNKKEMIRWSQNGITWIEFIEKLQETIKDPVFKKILTQ